MASFTVPAVSANADGWGPTTVPEALDGVPYAPFGKGDRIGRVADFTAAGLRYGACQSLQIVTYLFLGAWRHLRSIYH